MNQDFCICYYPWPSFKNSFIRHTQSWILFRPNIRQLKKWVFPSIFSLHFDILVAVSALHQNPITHSIQNKTSWMVWPLMTHTPTDNLTPTRSTPDQHFYLFYQSYYGYLIRLCTRSEICLSMLFFAISKANNWICVISFNALFERVFISVWKISKLTFW